VYIRKLKAHLNQNTSSNHENHDSSNIPETPDIIEITSDIIEIKTVKTSRTQTEPANSEEELDDKPTKSPTIPFEFKLLPDKRTTPIKGVTFELNDEASFPRLRQAERHREQLNSSSNGVSVDRKENQNKSPINVKLYISVAVILVFIYLIYTYIQDTNPKNPISDSF
jgi:hypothetical protein